MKALIAMSGGVDSSVAALLMKQAGYECTGATMRLFDKDNGMVASDACGGNKDVEDARAIAASLGMDYKVIDYVADFKEKIIDLFIRTYEQGGTPNPCIDCNRLMKFDKLVEAGREMGCDCVATGHYARVGFDETLGRYVLRKALDDSKDQSYVLYTLTQRQLEMARFPLGEMTKAHARDIAEEYGFSNARKHDSQDICFVPDGDYAGFIERTTGKKYVEGDFVTPDGEVLGRHKGIIHYTIGQRKGLGISSTAPLFVVDVDAENNEVVLTHGDGLFKKTVIAGDVNLIAYEHLDAPLRCSARIRYKHKEQPCTVEQIGDTLQIVFDEPQRAPTRGQSVVLYDGDLVIGGGKIINSY